MQQAWPWNVHTDSHCCCCLCRCPCHCLCCCCFCCCVCCSHTTPHRYADGPKYYSDPKLLSFELAPYSSPEVTAGLANAPDFSQGELLALHMASLAHQLQQFYAGAAVAAMLGRVLVLPTFQCYCYR